MLLSFLQIDIKWTIYFDRHTASKVNSSFISIDWGAGLLKNSMLYTYTNKAYQKTNLKKHLHTATNHMRMIKTKS